MSLRLCADRLPEERSSSDGTTLGSALACLGARLGKAEDAGEACRAVEEALCGFIHCDHLGVSFMTSPGTVTDVYASGTDVTGWERGARRDADASLLPNLSAGPPGVILSLADGPGDGRAAARSFAAAAASAGLSNAIVVPLVALGDIVGAVRLACKKPDTYTARDLETAFAIAAPAAHALMSHVRAGTIAETAPPPPGNSGGLTRGADNASRAHSAVLESTPDAMLVCDSRGTITYANPAAGRMLGYRATDLVGKPHSMFVSSDVCHVDEGDARGRAADNAWRLGATWETEARRRDGSTFPIEVSTARVQNGGEAAYAVAAIRDVSARRKAETALRASEARYRNLYDGAPDMFASLDVQSAQIVECNRAFAESLGYAKEELIGRTVFEMYDPASLPKARATFQKFAATGEVEDVALKMRRKDGSALDIVLSVSAIRDKQGRITHSRAVCRDVTERLRAEKVLELRSAALDAAADVVVITDRAGRIEYVNQAFAQVTGYSAEEAIGGNPRVLKSGRHHASFYQSMWETILSGRVWSGVLTNRRKDGSEYPDEMVITPVPGPDGAPTHFIAIKRDITERLRAEETLRLRSAALDAAADVVMITDRAGRIEYVNEAFAQVTGYSTEEAIGETPGLLKSGCQDASFYESMWETILSGRVWSGVVINRRKDGSEYPEEMTITPVPGPDGAPTHFIEVARDITERLRAEETEKQLVEERQQRLEIEKRELREISEAKTAFLSMVSHEVKTPLTSILAFNDLLLRDRERTLTPRQASQLRVMQRNGRRLDKLINDLLDMSRITAGRLRLNRTEFDLCALVEDVEASMLPTFQERRQQLKFALPEDCIWVKLDRDRIEQVIVNLLSNASKYSPENTQVELGAAADGSYLKMYVRDHGIGIAQEDQDRIFTSFFRSNTAATRSVPGVGLGLHISKSIVELHGGEVSLTSREGLGTTVSFRVPGVIPGPSRDFREPPNRAHARTPRSRLEELDGRDPRHPAASRHNA